MAINTAEKLHSIITFGETALVGVPVPNGPFDQGDLQHMLTGYSGVLWTQAIAQGDTIIGAACISFTAKQIGISFTEKQIGISFTGKRIGITFTEDNPCQ